MTYDEKYPPKRSAYGALSMFNGKADEAVAWLRAVAVLAPNGESRANWLEAVRLIESGETTL